ncbi:WXG100 family type VII secretion target [Mycobacterium sp. 236(2023)]|uniref:WXG100 family type VII secretion target n=1 Tax=Mycobacterium sp. 236(2023) TaxID=3038163 RepID=UPI0024155AA6|nr:WXG100 family type VII secretion target [Mycobacterium sp. 236(2023)]MDG4663670.1 WXG100 family type VII secretion target [Mycobacterium sp. 236(2023)]
MLPSRSTLQAWNPDSLTPSSAAVQSAGQDIGDAVSGIDDAISRMPETRGWSGAAHDAATGMFGRADASAQRFTQYTHAVAAALSNGAAALGPARSALLNKADQVDAGR